VIVREKTEIVSPCSTKFMVFITETACVYFAVRTGSLNINEVNLILKRVKMIAPTSTLKALNFTFVMYLRIACGSQNKRGLSSLLRHSGPSSDRNNMPTEFSGMFYKGRRSGMS
jgi:hypothetical protein